MTPEVKMTKQEFIELIEQNMDDKTVILKVHFKDDQVDTPLGPIAGFQTHIIVTMVNE